MTSPIQNRIGSVFIPVSDMPRAIAWYSRLLGLSTTSASHEGKIYDLTMAGETALILDAHRPPPPVERQTLLFFWTNDIQKAKQFLTEIDVELTSDITDIGSVLFLAFKDPDGNGLMVCQRKQQF